MVYSKRMFVLAAVLIALLVSVAGVGAQDDAQPVAQINVGGTIDGMTVSPDGSLRLLVDGQPVQVEPDGTISAPSGDDETDRSRFGVYSVADFLGQADEPDRDFASWGDSDDVIENWFVSLGTIGPNNDRALLVVNDQGEIAGGWSSIQGGWSAIAEEEIAGGWASIQGDDSSRGGWASIQAAAMTTNGGLFIITDDLRRAILYPDGTVEELGPITTTPDGAVDRVDILAVGPNGEVFVNINNMYYVFQDSNGRAYEFYIAKEGNTGALVMPDGTKVYEFYTEAEASPFALAAIDHQGNLFVSINNDPDILHFGLQGRISNLRSANSFTKVTGLGVDAAGQLIVADSTGVISFFDTMELETLE